MWDHSAFHHTGLTTPAIWRTRERPTRKRKMESLHRLKAARAKVARMVVADPIYAPIFERVEAEIAQLEAISANDVVARARAVIQSATR